MLRANLALNLKIESLSILIYHVRIYIELRSKPFIMNPTEATVDWRSTVNFSERLNIIMQMQVSFLLYIYLFL